MSSSDRPVRLTCEQVIDFLMDYLDGELHEDLRQRFETHLEVCTACKDYLDSYSKTVALGKQCFDEPEAFVAEMPESLVEAILTASKKPTN